jgi:hypothetical protein
MKAFPFYITYKLFLRALIESGCNGPSIWQINVLVVLLNNLEVKRPSGRATRTREVFIKIYRKGNGWGKWAVTALVVIVTGGNPLWNWV